MATAPPAQRWLLIEQPGPWGREALLESRFDASVAPELAARARAEHVRLLLIRRPGGRLADSDRRWAYADARPGREGLWWSTRTADADLLTAPWDGSVASRRDRTDLPRLHARRARRLLRAARAPAGPRAARAGSRRRVGVQPPRRGPLRGERAGAPARLLLRAGARGRRGRRRRTRAGRGGAALAAGPGRRPPARDRPPSSTPARSSASSASRTCRSPTSRRSPARAPRSSAGR